MPGDLWSTSWVDAAVRTTYEGDEHLGEDRLLAAGNCYLRAAEYYRLALTGTEPGTSEHRSWSDAQVSAFRAAVPLFPHPAVPFALAVDSTAVTGYLFRSVVDPFPPSIDAVTVVCPAAQHIPPESLYLLTAMPILELGHNCVIYGPMWDGILSAGTPPDGSHIADLMIGSVVEWVQNQPGVDPKRILLPPRTTSRSGDW